MSFFADLLASFLDVSTIRRHYKSKLLGPVLHGYLALRKLVVQRTKLVDETQQTLLELLEEMTSGNHDNGMMMIDGYKNRNMLTSMA